MTTPTQADLIAMKQRRQDADAVAGALATIADIVKPWDFIYVTPEVNGCKVQYKELSGDLAMAIIESGDERVVIHRMPYGDPKIAQDDFRALAQSRHLRAVGLQSIIEHWYTFVGAEELLNQAVKRVPSPAMAAPDQFSDLFPLLYGAVRT